MSLRLRTALALARPLARAIDLRPLLAAGVMAIGVVALLAREELAGTAELVTGLRMAGVLLGIGVAFVLDDPAAATTAATPASVLLRRAVRATLPLPLVGVLWAATFVVADRAGLPAPALTLELATVLALVHLLSVTTQRVTASTAGGTAASGLLLGLAAASLLMNPLRGPWVPYGEPAWNRVHVLWSVALLAVLLLVAWLSAAPARRWRPVRRHRGESRPRAARVPRGT